MERHWDGIHRAEFLFRFGFLSSLWPWLCTFVRSFTFYSVLSFLIFSCPFQPLSSSFYFLCHISFLERSFVDLVQTKKCNREREQGIENKNGNLFNLSLCLFRIFFMWFPLNARTVLHVYYDILTIPGKRFSVPFFKILCCFYVARF